MAEKSHYYILNCPLCDKNITKVMEDLHSNTVVCPYCNKSLNLYTVFGYNMWLSENGKSKKVSKRPIRIVSRSDIKEQDELDVEYEYEYENNSDYLDKLLQMNSDKINTLLNHNTKVICAQYNMLINSGFTRPEAVGFIECMIKGGFIL